MMSRENREAKAILQENCPVCEAVPGKRCRGMRRIGAALVKGRPLVLVHPHKERTERVAG